MSLIESQTASRDFSTSLRDFFTPSSSCFISCLKIEISDVRFPKCSCIWVSKRGSLSIIWLNCSRLRASDCLLSSITVLLERRFLLGDGVCCEDELDDLFSRSFLLDIRGCRVYRQILASMFHYQDIRIQKWRKNSTLGVLPVHKFTQRHWPVLPPWLLDPIPNLIKYSQSCFLGLLKDPYYSFKIFSRFWLAKNTRIIHHNKLLMNKFGRILCLTRKWRKMQRFCRLRHR